jgi:hypothetical protein
MMSHDPELQAAAVRDRQVMVVGCGRTNPAGQGDCGNGPRIAARENR